jgi:hypothetical protein
VVSSSLGIIRRYFENLHYQVNNTKNDNNYQRNYEIKGYKNKKIHLFSENGIAKKKRSYNSKYNLQES